MKAFDEADNGKTEPPCGTSNLDASENFRKNKLEITLTNTRGSCIILKIHKISVVRNKQLIKGARHEYFQNIPQAHHSRRVHPFEG